MVAGNKIVAVELDDRIQVLNGTRTIATGDVIQLHNGGREATILDDNGNLWKVWDFVEEGTEILACCNHCK